MRKSRLAISECELTAQRQQNSRVGALLGSNALYCHIFRHVYSPAVNQDNQYRIQVQTTCGYLIPRAQHREELQPLFDQQCMLDARTGPKTISMRLQFA